MNNLQNQLTLLIVGQIVTVLILLITNYINRRHASTLLEQEIQTRKRIDHFEQQLTKFYGPIYTILSMNKALLQARFDPETESYTKKVPDDLWRDLRDKIIIPNNQAIVEIIKNNFHLIEGIDIPPHIISFLVHAEVWPLSHKHEFSQEKYFENFRFPPEFMDYIQQTTETLKKEHHTLLERKQGIQKLKFKYKFPYLSPKWRKL